MRLDHLALRVKNRHESAKFFQTYPFNYKIQTEFEIPELNTKCLVLTPPEKTSKDQPFFYPLFQSHPYFYDDEYHLAPEIFISSSEDENSPVGQWVKERVNIGGIHHIAYTCDSVKTRMKYLKTHYNWKFTTEEPIVDEDIIQVFTKPIEVLGGLIIELISRPSSRGFSKKNVRDLMQSTA